jgi:hypothetical protein
MSSGSWMPSSGTATDSVLPTASATCDRATSIVRRAMEATCALMSSDVMPQVCRNGLGGDAAAVKSWRLKVSLAGRVTHHGLGCQGLAFEDLPGVPGYMYWCGQGCARPGSEFVAVKVIDGAPGRSMGGEPGRDYDLAPRVQA